jgi:hypothetical protein
MFLYNGKRFDANAPFTGPDGTQYPAGWFVTPEHREALGVVEVVEQTRPDDRFYWVQDNGDGTYTSSPKDLDDLKANQIKTVKNIAGSYLAQTDWKVIRSYDMGIALDQETKDARQAIRDRSNELETAINAAATVEELIDVNISTGWVQDDGVNS